MSQLVAAAFGRVDEVVQVLPLGEAVTTYLVITRSPVSLGSVQLTVATPESAKVRVFWVAVTSVGALGLVAGVVTSTAAVAELALPVKLPLFAFTVNV